MYSQSVKDAFIDTYRKLLGHIGQTCDIVGVSRTIYYEWRKEDEQFRQAIEDVDESFLDRAEQVLREAIDEDDTQAAMFLLRTIGKRRGYTQADQVQHSLGNAPVIQFVVGAAPEQKTIEIQAEVIPPAEISD